ncbi:hypothetical protein ATY41_10080 [Leifsonia xyli subsp. xyli]|uniref:Uncharacterized protein n=1 Tax=Leifsonia xyli subsp. xyli TaxID=59736 RepID=A0A1E2SKP8_LEIXY|nr:hypothetical protein [Leifsonia xyli]ODA90327.1 hypothetical protein ATY41_10080 [Leifsonia xyli subsp. xyli]
MEVGAGRDAGVAHETDDLSDRHLLTHGDPHGPRLHVAVLAADEFAADRVVDRHVHAAAIAARDHIAHHPVRDDPNRHARTRGEIDTEVVAGRPSGRRRPVRS